MDRVGTRRGLTIKRDVGIDRLSLDLAWPTAFRVCSISVSVRSGIFANWPGASKRFRMVSKARARTGRLRCTTAAHPWAVRSRLLILPVYFRWGGGIAFVIPGMLGFLWLIVWRKMSLPASGSPRISDAERQMILAGPRKLKPMEKPRLRMARPFELPQWGTMHLQGPYRSRLVLRQDWFSSTGRKGISLRA